MHRPMFLRACAAAFVAAVPLASARMPQLGDRLEQSREPGQSRPAPLVLKLDDVSVPHALAHWSMLSGLPVDPLWRDAKHVEGLDPERRVTLATEGKPMEVLEALLELLGDDEGAPTWQLNRRGGVQVGPRSRLNAFRRVEVYDIADLLRDAPQYEDAPAIGLDAAFSLEAGSIFTEEPAPPRVHGKSEDESGDELIDLIVASIEPEQWVQNGGSAASVTRRGAVLVVNAPGYVHRALTDR